METENPGKVRVFPWLVRWKFWRVLLVIVAALITLLALYHAEENWRGRRAWEDYEKAMETKGVSFDFATYIPPPVPDDQNFAMTPFLAPLFDFLPGTQKVRDTNAQARALSLGDRLKPFHTNKMDMWIEGKPLETRANPSNVLETLEAVDPILAEMQTASHRPYSRFNLDYDLELKAGILLPHLAVIKQLCQALELRASAELALGQTKAAFLDVDLMYRLMNSIQSEPFLISELSRAGNLTQMLQPIWEGLANHQWSDKQLEDFTQKLQSLNFLDDDGRVLRSECHLFDSLFAALRSNKNPVRLLNNMGDGRGPDAFGERLISMMIPSGWFYFEQLNYHRLFDSEIADVMTSKGIDPAVADRKDNDVRQELASAGPLAFFQHKAMSAILLPSLSNFERKMVRAQTYANLALIACALERYRLAHGEFPDSLDALAPQYLSAVPVDVIMDQPLKYHRTPDGQFILYSVGWNKKDDNGTVAKDTKEKTEGDWVWKYTPSMRAK
jgi:hypothetical protein